MAFGQHPVLSFKQFLSYSDFSHIFTRKLRTAVSTAISHITPNHSITARAQERHSRGRCDKVVGYVKRRTVGVKRGGTEIRCEHGVFVAFQLI